METSDINQARRLGRRGAAERWVPVLLAAATLAAFWPVCGHQFLQWDDQYTLWRNPQMNPPTWRSVVSWWTRPQEDLYIPVTYTLWGAVARLARTPPDPATGAALDPRPFHALNLVLHVLSVLMAYRVLVRLVRRPWPAAAGALLFGLHPVQVEPVAWASGMKDVLCGLLSLLAIDQYLRFAAPDGLDRLDGESEHPADRPPRAVGAVHYALATVAFALALLSKPAAVMMPVVAGLLDWLVVRRRIGRVLRGLWPWAVLSAACAVVAKLAQPTRRFKVPVPLWYRPFVAADALAFYLYKLLFPGWLAPDYGRSPSYVERHNWVYYTWLVPVAVALALGRLRPRPWPLIAAALVFVAAVFPVLGFVPFDFQSLSTVADHYLYFAMLGPALAAAWLLSQPACRVRGRAVLVAALCAVALTTLGVRSWFQTWHWRDMPTLLEHTWKIHPGGRPGGGPPPSP